MITLLLLAVIVAQFMWTNKKIADLRASTEAARGLAKEARLFGVDAIRQARKAIDSFSSTQSHTDGSIVELRTYIDNEIEKFKNGFAPTPGN